MAEYISPHLKTPLFIMNSAYDGYQLPEILKTPCQLGHVPNVSNCTVAELDEIQNYHSSLTAKIVAAVRSNRGSGASGCYVDSCWAHEQNVDYCSNQASPNCVGWTPASPGSRKWKYSTSVWSPTFKCAFTPQQAFSSYYMSPRGRRANGSTIPTADDDWALVDGTAFPANPTCPYSVQQAVAA